MERAVSAVDVVIPCYNAERTLGATLASVLAEDGVATITVVDDGSRDGSLALARSHGPRVATLTGPNQGVARARNRGIAEGRAEWLLLLDSDDLLVPGTLARRLAAAEETGADVVICDWEDFSDGAEAEPGTPRLLDWTALRDDPERAVAAGVWAPPAAILVRRSLFARTIGFRADLPPIEDARFLFDVARLGARFAHAAHRGARYRVAPSSLSRSDPGRFWAQILRNGQQIEAVWREDGSLSPARRQTVGDIYDVAARGLFRLGHPDYFAAVAARRRLGLSPTLHGRVTAPLARLLGLALARRIVGLAHRPSPDGCP